MERHSVAFGFGSEGTGSAGGEVSGRGGGAGACHPDGELRGSAERSKRFASAGTGGTGIAVALRCGAEM